MQSVGCFALREKDGKEKTTHSYVIDCPLNAEQKSLEVLVRRGGSAHGCLAIAIFISYFQFKLAVSIFT